MKKLICLILCVALTAISAVSVSATTDDTKDFRILGTYTVPYNTVRITKFGIGIDSTSRVQLIDYSGYKSPTIYMPNNNYYVDTLVSSREGYKLYVFYTGGGRNFLPVQNFTNTGGTYENIRIKLSDFSLYFNEDGTHTHSLAENVTYNFNFTDEQNGYKSQLLFICGAYYTFAAPDKYGYVNIFASTKIGEKIYYITNFYSPYSVGGGTESSIGSLTIGETNGDEYISVTDATYLQKCLVGKETLANDTLTKRNCDTNRDGKINILDATEIQKYLVGK